MSWIESHTSLDKHHKVIRLRLAMRWSKNETIGFLHRFWWTVMEVSPSGDITSLSSPEVMAEMLDMPVTAMAQALRVMEDPDPKLAFLDRKGGRLLVHDWLDYAGRYLNDSKFRRSPEKMEEIKQIYRTAALLPTVSVPSADSPPTVGDTLPTLPTLPNQKPARVPAARTPRVKGREEKPIPPEVLAVYGFYRRHFAASARKADAVKWIERRGQEHGYERLIMAINLYRLEATEKKTEPKFYKDCANFFGEDAAFEAHLPESEFYQKYLAKARVELNGGTDGKAD